MLGKAAADCMENSYGAATSNVAAPRSAEHTQDVPWGDVGGDFSDEDFQRGNHLGNGSAGDK